MSNVTGVEKNVAIVVYAASTESFLVVKDTAKLHGRLKKVPFFQNYSIFRFIAGLICKYTF